MNELENYVSEQLKTLVSNYDVIELEAAVTSSSVSVEFFATVEGKRMQCFQMIDNGMFTEKDFNAVSKAIANYIRRQPAFNKDGINRYAVVLK